MKVLLQNTSQNAIVWFSNVWFMCSLLAIVLALDDEGMKPDVLLCWSKKVELLDARIEYLDATPVPYT